MKFYSVSDIGLVRTKNQDSYITIYNENRDLLVLVCDGIGGAKAGEVASFEIVKYFSENFTTSKGFKDSTEAINYLKEQARLASNRVYELSLRHKKYEGMGTTISGILISSCGNYVINAGDSRVYSLHSKHLRQLTQDNTYVNELVQRRVISEEEAITHPKRHYLTKYLGVFKDASVEVYRVSNFSEYYLVCSDGLHGYVSDSSIETILNEKISLENKANKLLKSAFEAGGGDNVTFVLIKTDEGEKND